MTKFYNKATGAVYEPPAELEAQYKADSRFVTRKPKQQKAEPEPEETEEAPEGAEVTD